MLLDSGRGAAIVIGGAVAKGAFAAGALEVLTHRLAQHHKPIRAVLGTSSGALNATVLAAGVRAGDAAGAAAKLSKLWQNEASLGKVFDLDFCAAVRLSGASSLDRVVKLLAEVCPDTGDGSTAPSVALRIVTAPLAGKGVRTTFEHVERFADHDFEKPAQRERMFQAAAASAAFPYAFAPVDLAGVGPCVDGGIVNNTPIQEAIEHDPGIDVVYVVVADPSDMTMPVKQAAALGGLFGLGVRLVEMVANERLFRDLEEARDADGSRLSMPSSARRRSTNRPARRSSGASTRSAIPSTTGRSRSSRSGPTAC